MLMNVLVKYKRDVYTLCDLLCESFGPFEPAESRKKALGLVSKMRSYLTGDFPKAMLAIDAVEYELEQQNTTLQIMLNLQTDLWSAISEDIETDVEVTSYECSIKIRDILEVNSLVHELIGSTSDASDTAGSDVGLIKVTKKQLQTLTGLTPAAMTKRYKDPSKWGYSNITPSTVDIASSEFNSLNAAYSARKAADEQRSRYN